MKRILYFFMSLIFIFTFISCSVENSIQPTSVNESISFTEESTKERITIPIAASEKITEADSKEENNNSNYSRTVFITPTGKRYHYLSTCGGKNSFVTTLSKAKAAGLTPCKKCAY